MDGLIVIHLADVLSKVKQEWISFGVNQWGSGVSSHNLLITSADLSVTAKLPWLWLCIWNMVWSLKCWKCSLILKLKLDKHKEEICSCYIPGCKLVLMSVQGLTSKLSLHPEILTHRKVLILRVMAENVILLRSKMSCYSTVTSCLLTPNIS